MIRILLALAATATAMMFCPSRAESAQAGEIAWCMASSGDCPCNCCGCTCGCQEGLPCTCCGCECQKKKTQKVYYTKLPAPPSYRARHLQPSKKMKMMIAKINGRRTIRVLCDSAERGNGSNGSCASGSCGVGQPTYRPATFSRSYAPAYAPRSYGGNYSGGYAPSYGGSYGMPAMRSPGVSFGGGYSGRVSRGGGGFGGGGGSC